MENSASVTNPAPMTEYLATEITTEMSEEDKQKVFDQQAMAAGMGPGIGGGY